MWDMSHHRPLGDQMSGMGQYPFPPRKPQQELSPGGGRKNIAAIGPMKKNKLGFDDMDDDFGNAGMYFNQSVFPPHRPEKEMGPPHTSSQPGSHLGNLYGNPSGPQSNFYGSGGMHTPGMPPNMNSMQVHPGSNARGMSSQPHQFGRSLSHPAQSHHASHLSGNVSSSGVPNMPSSLHGIVGSQGNSTTSQAGRGILSMNPRGIMGQVPPSAGQIGSQSGLSGLPKTSRTTTLTSSLSSPSRSSPIMGMPISQPPTQPPQNQQQRFNFGSSSAAGPMGSFGMSRSQSVSSGSQLGSSFQVSGSLQSLTSAFGPPGHSDGMSPGSSSLDLSDFPVLANRVRQESSSQAGGVSSAGLVSRPSYGVVSKPLEPTPDFSIDNEDFPALPGSSAFKPDNQSDSSSQQDLSKQGISATSSVFPGVDMQPNTSYEQALKESREARYADSKSQQNNKAPPRGIQTTTSGVITNIPKGMVTDQFGMIGLLTFIRAAETEPNLVTLALGSDLTTLGLNLNSPESLYHTFGSPFADSPSRPHEIDYHVPAEYRINSYIRDKLAPIKLSRYAEDLLFYIYYTNGGDILQLAAAAELYARDWRYHKDERVWLTRVMGVDPQVKTNTYERGTYYFFDCSSWRKVAKEFHLEYDKLEEKPTLQPTAQ